MVFLEHRPRVYYSLTIIIQQYVEATALLFVQQHVKGAIIVYHVTPPHGRKWPLYRMIVRVALPTAASPGFISGELGISAALDAFSTVYELPLTRF